MSSASPYGRLDLAYGYDPRERRLISSETEIPGTGLDKAPEFTELEGVDSISFSYWDPSGKRWASSWDGKREGRLPSAVRMETCLAGHTGSGPRTYIARIPGGGVQYDPQR